MVEPRCVLRMDNILGEAPVWCPRSGRLWWTDVNEVELHSFCPLSNDHARYKLPGMTLGSIALRAKGGMLLALDSALQGFDPESGTLEMLVEPEAPGIGNRLNDSKCDRLGRYWVGTMDRHIRSPAGAFYKIGGDLSVEKMFDDVLTPNSVAFSPDDKRLYFSDTRRFKIWTFDFDLEEGRISNRQLFSDTAGWPGRPDGSTVDSEGYLWNAEFAGGRVVRYDPAGRIDRVITMPVSQPTCVTFGGPDYRTMFITTARLFLEAADLERQPLAGSLFAVDLDIGGLPEPMFAG